MRVLTETVRGLRKFMLVLAMLHQFSCEPSKLGRKVASSSSNGLVGDDICRLLGA